MKFKSSTLPLLLCIAAWQSCFAEISGEREFFFRDGKDTYRYVTSRTGDNFNFEFEKDPGDPKKRINAALHVLQSLYDDPSIEPQYSEAYTRERARCLVFDADYHSYTVCVLPNEFSPNDEDLFQGFVTQLPNWKWLLTRNVLPALLAIGIFLALTRKKTNRI